MAEQQLGKVLDEKLEENEKMALLERTFMYDGVLYPMMICCLETLKRINTFRAREDDIILAAYPKSGTNWVQQILTQLEVASRKYDEDKHKQWQPTLQELSLISFLEFGDLGKFERMEKLPSRRILKTHLIPQKLPKSIFEKKAKVLVLIRNPKDIAVSYFHFSKGIKLISDHETWDQFLEAFITGKGIVGDWTSAFSESQREKMDRKFEESVAKTKLGMMLNYEPYCKN
ncbi:sulfotransferase 6B1-like [Vipera latastei]